MLGAQPSAVTSHRPTAEPAPPRPAPRGPLSAYLLEHLVLPPHELPPMPSPIDDPLSGDDSQLALYCCYELHYRSLAGVSDGWEWEPSLLGFRRRLETAFEHRLREETGPVSPPADVEWALEETIAEADGPSLSRHMCEAGTLEQMREFAAHRSAYQLKEADPHTWGIPRLHGAPKAALVEIQLDEYGGGAACRMHSTLFATTMEALGLDSRYGAYVDLLPGVTLATTNLVSMFGLHRRRRGALAGHLAVFEMTSVTPMGRYSAALRRLGLDERARRFFDVHVAADVHHRTVACRGLAAGLAAAEPALVTDIVLGARAIMLLEALFSSHLLRSWADGHTSLLAPLGSGR